MPAARTAKPRFRHGSITRYVIVIEPFPAASAGARPGVPRVPPRRDIGRR